MIDLDKLVGLSLTMAFIALGIFIISKARFFTQSPIPQKLLMGAFLFKLTLGFAVGYVYSEYYTDRTKADTYKYFDDSATLFNVIHESPSHYLKMMCGIGSNLPELEKYYDRMNHWYDVHSPMNDNRAMIRLNAFIRLFSMGHYHVHVVIFCFLSLIGMVAATKAIYMYHPNYALKLFMLFICIPSVVFWTSGLLKDSLTLFALGLTLMTMVSLLNDYKPVKALGFMMCLVLLLNVRFQFFMLLIPVCIAWFATAAFKKHKNAIFLMGIGTIISLVIFSWGPIFEQAFMEVLSKKREAFISLASLENSRSLFSNRPLETNAFALIWEPILGLWNAVTRPYLEIESGLTNIVAGIENVILITVAFILLFNTILNRSREWSVFLTMVLTISCIYLAIVGMVAPISGALVRYKALVLPFLLVPLWVSSGIGYNPSSILPSFFRSKKGMNQ